MATVWRVHDRRHHRTVALKMLRSELAEAIATERFLREVRVAAGLQHPGILPMFDSGEVAGIPWYVMPYVAGESLRDKLYRERQLPVEEAVRITRQVAAALAYAHQRGIVHRDVKPENILLADGQAYLADFGVAFAMQQADVGRLTQSGLVMGTPQYLSPELASGEHAIDGRSDQWALGAVLYEMLAGQPPHSGPTLQSLTARILTEAPTPLSILRPGIPAPLEIVTMRALQKVPADRYADTAAFDAALHSAMAAPSTSSVTGARPARRAWPWIGAAALLLVAIAVWRTIAAPPVGPPLRLSLVPPDGEHFVSGLTEGGEALSPDGQSVAFVASNKGKTSLWVQKLGGVGVTLLAQTEGAAFPFWSPDGRSIGYFAGDKLMRVSLEGGAPVMICSVRVGRGASWTDDERIVFSDFGDLLIVSDAGGTPTQLIPRPDSSTQLRFPQVLPGGRVMFYAPLLKPAQSRTYIASLSNPADSVLILENETEPVYTQDGRGNDYLLFIRNGSLVAQPFDVAAGRLTGVAKLVADSAHGLALSGRATMTASKSGTLLFNSTANVTGQLTWFDRNGRNPSELGEATPYNESRLSLDGQRVVASREGPGGVYLWSIDVARNTSARLQTDMDIAIYPVWMPDGRTVLYSSDLIRNIFKREANGGQQRLTRGKAHQLANDVCRDGRVALLYQVAPKTQRDLWSLALDTPNAVPQPYLVTPSHEAFARFSPDCKWVAYQSDETGQYEAYIDTYPTPTQRVRVSTTAGGGHYPMWAQDKSGALELLYLAGDGMIVSVPVSTAEGSARLGASRDLFRIPRVDYVASPIDVTSDGQRFLVRVLPVNAPLSVIVNWPGLLK